MVVELDRELDIWIKTARPTDTLRVLMGGPGSGKSSVARMFAARLIEDEKLRAVWVPLHRLVFKGDLISAINHFCRAPESPPEGFLDTQAARVVLILDGLDELATGGHPAIESASSLIDGVLRIQRQYNSGGDVRLLVLLTGRDIAIQGHAPALRRSIAMVLLGHYIEPSLRSQFTAPDRQLLTEDRRQNWWLKYRTATGKGSVKIPSALGKVELDELTSQPILNVLLSLAWSRNDNGPSRSAWGIGTVYQKLFDQVYDRVWDEPHSAHSLLSRDSYKRVLEEIAVGAWHNGEAREVSAALVEERCRRSGELDSLRKFSEVARWGTATLLATFYFRATGDRSSEGLFFEFTHKSFCEYLVASRLLREIRSYEREYSGLGSSVERADFCLLSLMKWAEVTGARRLEHHTVKIFESLASNLEDAEDLHAVMVYLLQSVLDRDYPIDRVLSGDYMEMKHQARNAELALVVSVSILATLAKRSSEISWRSEMDPINRLHWLTSGRVSGSILGDYGLARMDLSSADLAGAFLHDVSLQCSNLESAVLDKANFSKADLSGANLSFVSAKGAEFIGSCLDGAVLRGASLGGAKLLQCSLRGADLENADLRGAEISDADFTGANLKGAKLPEGYLES